MYSHNFSGFEAGLLVQNLHSVRERVWLTTAIPLNTQRLKMLRINNLIFLDSLSFLPMSLEKVGAMLLSSSHSWPLMRQRKWGTLFDENNAVDEEECLSLLWRKGCYPYRWLRSVDCLHATKALPVREEFFSDIGDQPISEEDYSHAQKVWTLFRCRDMYDYTLLYNLVDSYLLAEGMMDMKKRIWEDSEVDLGVYLSLPMLSKDLMLLHTGARLQLLDDVEMVRLCKQVRKAVMYWSCRSSEIPSHESIGKAVEY